MSNQSTRRKHNELLQIFANFITRMLYRIYIALGGNQTQKL